jgi:DNA-binding MarR family transcriptional regulator
MVKAPQITLLAVYHPQDIRLSVTDLGKLTGLSAAHASTAIKALVDSGKMVRHYPARDRRTVTLYLTPQGKTAAEKMLEAWLPDQNVAAVCCTADT